MRQCAPKRKKANINNYCGEWKDINEFPNNKYQCRICVARYQKQHKDKPENKEKAKIYIRQYYNDNKEEIKIINTKYYEEHREEKLAYQKTYREKYPEQTQKSANESMKKRRKNDPIWACQRDVSQQVWTRLEKLGSSKQGESTKNYFPWTDEEIKRDFETKFLLPENLGPDGEPWMTWNNRGRYDEHTWNDNDPTTWTWQTDHIKPHSEFYYITMDCEEFRRCWALKNLRPLSAKQNWLDGINRIRHNKDIK